jgi:hypothetical protein
VQRERRALGIARETRQDLRRHHRKSFGAGVRAHREHGAGGTVERFVYLDVKAHALASVQPRREDL